RRFFAERIVGVVPVIANRRWVDPVLAEARSIGAVFSAVDGLEASGDCGVLSPLSRGEAPPSLAGRLSWAIGIATAVLVLVAAATAVIALQRQDQALERLEVETNAARKEAQVVRKRVQDVDTLSERIGVLRLHRAEGLRVVALWEEMTRVLPDTAWLTNLRV